MTKEYRQRLLLVLCAAEAEGLLDQPVKRRRFWIDPLNDKEQRQGTYENFYDEIRNDEQKFFEYYRMSIKSFDELLELIRPRITLKDSFCRNPIKAELRLSITLRYLGSGKNFGALQTECFIARSTIATIVKSTCQAIWSILKEKEMPALTVEQWTDIASKFYENTSFPNCVGAIDGKHIVCIHPRNFSGTSFVKYKNRSSVVLTAIADANLNFIAIDVGPCGPVGNTFEFKESPLGKSLFAGQMNFPPPRCLPGTDANPQPFVVVGNEAFRVHKSLLRPYPQRQLDERKKVFYDRLFLCRQPVEDAFSALSSKWRVFQTPIMVKPDFIDAIVKACCILHNFVRKREGPYSEVVEMSPFLNVTSCGPCGGGQKEGLEVRNYFTDHFIGRGTGTSPL